MIHWLLLTLPCISMVRLQFIAGDPSCKLLESEGTQLPTISNYFNIPLSRLGQDVQPNEMPIDSSFYRNDDREQMEPQRKKRTINEYEKESVSNIIENDKTSDVNKENNFIEQEKEENATELLDLEKKSFSPWGGKRDDMWSWKRGALRELNMPKRVRFSPWGGKRSGHMIYKPGQKGTKIILTALAPELTRILSKYLPKTTDMDTAGFRFIPIINKSHPIKMLTLSTNENERILRDALPYKNFVDSLPKIFKIGHPYSELTIKKDGKRKVKFSAWGGKRTPPIIGPVWTPTTKDLKEATLNAILLLRNSPEFQRGLIGKGL